MTGHNHQTLDGLGIFSGLVDKIYILSLPSAIERRERLPKHLAEFGITNFEWHDGYGPDAPEVQALFDTGQVFQFPPCFRCGQERCKCFNNALIPPQVANFAGFLSIWRKISASNSPALVMEDDIILHPWAPRILKKLKHRITKGTLDFSPTTPKLLRLSSPHSEEHSKWRRFRLIDDVRMSNYCYAMTPAFAAQVVAEFDGVNTTSDVHLHQNAPKPGQALTLLPPIATDLSWSTGSLDSHIHPKENHLEHLKAHGTKEEIEAHHQRLRQHIKRIYSRPILCVSHPNAGAESLAQMLQTAGLEIGFEQDGYDGLSSSALAVEAHENPNSDDPIARTRRALHWKHLIQAVQDPKTAVSDILNLNAENQSFLRDHILRLTGTDLNDFETGADRAVASLCLWSQIIRDQNPAFTCRIEQDAPDLLVYLKSEGYEVNEGAITSQAQPNAPETTPDWSSLSAKAAKLLQDYCKTYRYDLPEGCNT
ncbi:hypothetical protein ROA7450_01639 [Roseovarius albus]|uniref:Glycosyl transferase family 25 domain-containing protein n=1 Tax=Roseovarius albus TaxID=1247867 RepID=A0A1X6YYA8_9RHOB|nr:glycosyltransferase family 25 protein [Roseovarius albus]SLN35320.1 hypothetical protein ROA7450_01639 [Roseovarius albus]